MPEHETSLGHLLMCVCRTYRREMDARLRPEGLHCGQDTFLMRLGEEEDLTQTELGERLGVEPPTVSKMIRRVEKQGLVERTEDPEDARVMRTRLTDEGRAKQAQVRRCWQDLEEEAFASLTAEERTLLRGIFLQIRSQLE